LVWTAFATIRLYMQHIGTDCWRSFVCISIVEESTLIGFDY